MHESDKSPERGFGGRNTAAYFPKPLPDETATSIIARYRRHTGMTHSAVSEEIFGKSTKGAFATMPPRMDALARRMPKELGYDLQRLIHEHTATNYYTAFMTDAQRQHTINQLLIGDASGQRATGSNSKPTKPASHLRFCSACADEQLAKHGEAYWRRTHPLPIVTICPQHLIPLKNSRIKTVGVWSAYVSHDDTNCPKDAVSVLPEDPNTDYDLMLMLSQTAERLLHGRYPNGLTREFPDQLLSNLDAKGYVFAEKRVRWDDLKVEARKLLDGAIGAFPDILEEDEVGPWFLRLREGRHPHSTDRVILAHQVISNLRPNETAFGQAPWPCLNPLVGHFGQRLVTDMRHLRSVDGIGYGRFSCECGYQYTQSTNSDGVLGDATVWEFGPSLVEHIREAIEKGWSLRQTHLKAGVGSNTMLRHAKRQGIQHPWREPGPTKKTESFL